MAESSTPVYEAETVIKNEYDFRREILKALDNEFPSPSDAKDTELFRKSLLSALNQEFDQDDIKQTDRFRGKLVKGISELGGGGGDFSMAEVIINMSTASGGWTSWGLSSALPILTAQGEINNSVTTFPSGTYTFDKNVIFYQNTPYERDIYSDSEYPLTATVTGNISIIGSEPDAVSVSIAGAGTINVVINDLA